ncbi:hypothetical protein V8C86DRAFT_2572646 [Haematococcus lacustris]
MTSHAAEQEETTEAARAYADACVTGPKEYSEYEALNVEWEEAYEIVRKVGRGKYSEVFEGINVLSSQRCVVKVLKPVKRKKIKREIKILQHRLQLLPVPGGALPLDGCEIG